MTRRRNLLLSVEGVTGAGKSTVCRRLRASWRGPPPLVILGGYFARITTPDPFHRDLLRIIRRQLRRDEFMRIPWRAECLALQAELLLAENSLVQPALKKAGIVVYEHYTDSIIAYQAARLVELGGAESIGRAVVAVAKTLAEFEPRAKPEAVVFIDKDPGEAAARAARRDGRRLTSKARRFNELVDEAGSDRQKARRFDRVGELRS